MNIGWIVMFDDCLQGNNQWLTIIDYDWFAMFIYYGRAYKSHYHDNQRNLVIIIIDTVIMVQYIIVSKEISL